MIIYYLFRKEQSVKRRRFVGEYYNSYDFFVMQVWNSVTYSTTVRHSIIVCQYSIGKHNAQEYPSTCIGLSLFPAPFFISPHLVVEIGQDAPPSYACSG